MIRKILKNEWSVEGTMLLLQMTRVRHFLAWMEERATLERTDTRVPVHTCSLELDAKHVHFNIHDK